MKKLFLLALTLFASNAYAQSTSSTWIDVTSAAYGAKNDCSADAGPSINVAISHAPPGSGVIFFPAGCYLINTQIVDDNSAAWLSYIGEGNAMLLAQAGTNGQNIISFGINTTNGVAYRKINNLFFNCNNAIRGINADGLHDSEFYDVTIAKCQSGAHLEASGPNSYSNRFIGGAIYSPRGVQGVTLGPGANSWSFFGTKIIGDPLGCSGDGIDSSANSGAFYGLEVAGWCNGISLQLQTSAPPPQQGGVVISGSHFLANQTAILAGNPQVKTAGLSISGNVIDCGGNPNTSNTGGITLAAATGFRIVGNQITRCTGFSIFGQGPSSAGPPDFGAINGFMGANFLDPGAQVSLAGRYNTVTASLATVSVNYTLNGADSQVNVTGNTAITIPHAMTAQQWTVFNSGTGNVSLACDSGTINGQTSLSLAPQTGKTVTTDGTSCFAL